RRAQARPGRPAAGARAARRPPEPGAPRRRRAGRRAGRARGRDAVRANAAHRRGRSARVSMRMPLALWTGFVLTFAALSYSVRFSAGKPEKDVLYKWSTAAAGLAQFVVVALIIYGIAGLGRRPELLALRRPTSWRLAGLIAVGIGIAMLVLLRL